jgi:hypothetical protein
MARRYDIDYEIKSMMEWYCSNMYILTQESDNHIDARKYGY